MNSLFINNREEYLKRFKTDITIPEPSEPLTAKTGKKTLKMGEVWLASRYDPMKEAERFATLQKINKGDYVVLYGIGLGYHIAPILDRIGSDGFLYCIETNPKLIANALNVSDFTEIFQDPRFFLIASSTPEKFAAALDRYILWNLETVPSDSIKVIIHEASFSQIPESFQFIKTILERLKFEREGDSRFEEEMADNLKANKDALCNAFPLKIFSKIIGDYPVIVAGAGPSLDDSLNFINEVQNRAVIIAVDTAVTPLLANNIRPDFAITIDPQNKSSANFIIEDSHYIPLLMFPTSQKDIIAANHAEKIICILKNSWAANKFDNKLDFIGLSFGGSSVSVIAADIALNHAGGAVIFAGFDFSFPGMNSYASQTAELNKWRDHLGPCFTIESAEFNLINSKKTVTVESFSGKLIPTFQSLYSYLRSLEAVIEFHSRSDIYIITPKGAFIRGVTPIYDFLNLEELMPDHEKKLFFPERKPLPAEIIELISKTVESL